jgi:hypothetical protein
MPKGRGKRKQKPNKKLRDQKVKAAAKTEVKK